MNGGRSNETYNISASNLMTNMELVQRINDIVKDLSGTKSVINLVEDRPGHDRRYSLDSQKIRKELQWKPLIHFQEALTSDCKMVY